MGRTRSSFGPSGTTAVSVRLVAFFVTLAAIVAIPTALLVASQGAIPLSSAAVTIGSATVLILVALFAVRRFDPFRG